MLFYIYKITNKLNGKIYIGQHKHREGEGLRAYMGRGANINKAYKEYGKKNFTKEIIEWVEDDEKRLKVDERERFWISELKTDVEGYNIGPGGKVSCTPEVGKRVAATRKAHGYRPSEDTKRKMSLASKGVPKSDAHKLSLSLHHRLRTEHIIVFDDGSPEERTFDSISKIASRFGVDTTTLRRRSSKNLFTGGIKLLDEIGREYSKGEPPKDSVYFDPVRKETCSYSALVGRKYKNPDLYKDVIVSKCLLKKGEK